MLPPDEIKMELDYGIGGSSALDNIAESLDQLTIQAQKVLGNGTMNAQELIERTIDVTVIEED